MLRGGSTSCQEASICGKTAFRQEGRRFSNFLNLSKYNEIRNDNSASNSSTYYITALGKGVGVRALVSKQRGFSCLAFS